MDHIAIVGGGPGGLLLARLLQLRGLSPVVFERDTHAGERPQGGSLDLHGETGQRAMRVAGLCDRCKGADVHYRKPLRLSEAGPT